MNGTGWEITQAWLGTGARREKRSKEMTDQRWETAELHAPPNGDQRWETIEFYPPVGAEQPNGAEQLVQFLNENRLGPGEVRLNPASPKCARTKALSGSSCSPASRLILGDRDITFNAGEVAEFDTRIPHWFGPADDQPAEILSLLSGHGKHMHVRAAATAKAKKDCLSIRTQGSSWRCRASSSLRRVSSFSALSSSSRAVSHSSRVPVL